MAYSILTETQKKRFEMENELDFSFGIKGLSRFRANVFVQKGCVSVAIRSIPFEIFSFEELGLPPVLEQLCNYSKGLILVTGPTGSGKSTTLAAMVDKINTDRAAHIITLEDPIEFIHKNKKSIINQREIGSDSRSFPLALRYVLRQDPDVILVGEMRDLETISAALTIAETGHLVMATLHTNSAIESINRIIDVFPSHQQPQIRSQLSFVLSGVFSQQLVSKAREPGRMLTLEVLVCTPAVRAQIRDNKVHQIYSLMQAGAKYGMQTLNECLFNGVIKNVINEENALQHSSNPEELKTMIHNRISTHIL
jgi:twitching motility protein PilT